MTTNQLITKIGRPQVITALLNVVCNSPADHIDGGSANSVYQSEQTIDGGDA